MLDRQVRNAILIAVDEPISKAVRDAMSRFGKLGGDARKKKLSRKRRVAIATMGGKARAAKRGNGS